MGRMGDVWRPDWWDYPLGCRNGHPWGPGRVLVSWTPCPCGGDLGHSRVHCATLGCQETWYEPPHAPGADLRGPEGLAAQQGYRFDWHPAAAELRQP